LALDTSTTFKFLPFLLNKKGYAPIKLSYAELIQIVKKEKDHKEYFKNGRISRIKLKMCVNNRRIKGIFCIYTKSVEMFFE